ncbi:MAG: peptidylprolyl isomerase [Acidobacteria bacterium]|nr:peptidylprolyl isomerase [Acidobacteriota bacterium]
MKNVLPALAWCVLLSLSSPAAVVAQPAVTPQMQADALEQIIQGEDARDADMIRAAMSRGAQRRNGIRALGRLEQPEMIRYVAPALGDGVGIRAEAAWALAQLATTPEAVAQVQDLIIERATQDADAGLWEVWGEMAAALGRLPYTTPEQVARTETLLVDRLPSPDSFDEPETAAIIGAVRGLESLARVSRKVAQFQPRTWDRLRWSATAQRPAADPRSSWIRRLAMAALVTGNEVTTSIVERALADRDTEVRRLGTVALAADGEMADRAALIQQALKDPEPQVRLEAVRAWSRRLPSPTCAPLQAATRDPNPHVQIQAIDELGTCTAAEGVTELTAFVQAPPADTPRAWHVPSHALVALARRQPDGARKALPAFAAHQTWQVRMYAARAAAVLNAHDVLVKLATDAHANVREAALSALIEAKRPEAVPAAIDALNKADDHQLVRTATRAFVDADTRAKAVPALVASLAALTKQQKDTSRDPRMAILDRLEALGDRAQASALEPYLKDFDPAIAEKTATILTAWTGAPKTAAPARIMAPPTTLAMVQALRSRKLRVTMAGLGTFDIALDVDVAPLTAVRIASRAEAGYYNGTTFHRLSPNFVIQGGSPGANEYAGDARYMRDEVGTHRRGAVGISTRGRDTGDAQIFVNLVDSPRLDHQYTVFGTVVSGMDVVDRVLEGDVIERIDVVD